MGIFNRHCSELRIINFRYLVMNWLQWILQHPGEIFQLVKLTFQIAHKLTVKRRAKRLRDKKAIEEENRIKVYRYAGKTDLK